MRTSARTSHLRSRGQRIGQTSQHSHKRSNHCRLKDVPGESADGDQQSQTNKNCSMTPPIVNPYLNRRRVLLAEQVAEQEPEPVEQPEQEPEPTDVDMGQQSQRRKTLQERTYTLAGTNSRKKRRKNAGIFRVTATFSVTRVTRRNKTSHVQSK